MNDNLEEVKRSRAALNIKIRSVFINEKTLVYINSYESEEEERIWKSWKLAGCPEAFVWERILEIAELVECFPVIGEIPRCSDILVCRCKSRLFS